MERTMAALAPAETQIQKGARKTMINGAVIYTRVSTLVQSEEGSSLDTQADAGIAFAKELNVPVLNVYREVYTGAELYDRPKLSEARADMKAGRCSHLIAYAIDRLSRDPIHVAILAMEAERAGVQLLFVTEPLDNTPEGQLIRYVKGYAAQIEREKIRERCIRGKRARATAGLIHNAGGELYGYRREAGSRIIHVAESIIVASIFARIVEGGDSVRSVARSLNRDGCHAPSIGKRAYKDGHTPRWGKTTVARILREPSYKGEAIAWRWQSKKLGGRQVIFLRPASEHIRLPEGTAPAIVSTKIWEKAQPLDNGGANTRNIQREYLLRGRITCNKCGQAMYSESSKGKRWYRCSSRDKAGKCGAAATPAEEAEQFVWQKLSQGIRRPKIITAGLKTVVDNLELSRLKAERKDIEVALAANLSGLQKIIRRFRQIESSVLMTALDNEVKNAEQEQAMLREKIEEIDGRMRAAKGVVIDFAKLKSYCEDVAARLAEFNFADKILALRAWGGKIVAEGRKVWLHIDISDFVVGESATTYSNCSQSAEPIIKTFPNRFAKAA